MPSPVIAIAGAVLAFVAAVVTIRQRHRERMGE